MNYQDTIRSIDPNVNPVGVEASMRLEFGTLDHLSVEQFAAEVELARKMEASEPGILGRLASSYGMGREFIAAEQQVSRLFLL